MFAKSPASASAMSRRPLQKYDSNVAGPMRLELTDTPLTHISGKFTTPPHLVYVKRNHSVLDTPVRAYEPAPRSVLLSPAFSSPQPPNPPVFEHPGSHGQFEHSGNHGQLGQLGPAAQIAPTPFLAPVIPDFGAALAATAQKKKRPKKPRREARDAGFSLDSHEKPPYSYATLIGMSILTHPAKQLTLSQIYLWISDTFKYYRREDVGWQNLIRHNLSLNKAFVKGAKSKDGKGHFWCIMEESEDLFLKSKNNKKSLYHEVMDQLAVARRNASLASLPLSPTALSDDSRKRPAEQNDCDSKRARTEFWDGRNDSDSDTGPDVDSLLLRTPAPLAVVADSPDKPLLAGKHLTFASSFSCSLNLELLPAQPLELGPLLEPLTPAGNVLLQSGMHIPTITFNRVVQHLPQLQPPIPTLSTPRAAGSARTPKSSVKTPLRTVRTPLGSTLVRKLWHSPSYLEEFYHSPFGAGRAVLNSYDDDDMLMRAFDSPAASSGKASLLHELRRADETPQSDITDIDGSVDSE